MINWKVRIKNKTFWLSLIPALLLLAQALGAVFGLSLDLSAAVSYTHLTLPTTSRV